MWDSLDSIIHRMDTKGRQVWSQKNISSGKRSIHLLHDSPQHWLSEWWPVVFNVGYMEILIVDGIRVIFFICHRHIQGRSCKKYWYSLVIFNVEGPVCTMYTVIRGGSISLCVAYTMCELVKDMTIGWLLNASETGLALTRIMTSEHGWVEASTTVIAIYPGTKQHCPLWHSSKQFSGSLDTTIYIMATIDSTKCCIFAMYIYLGRNIGKVSGSYQEIIPRLIHFIAPILCHTPRSIQKYFHGFRKCVFYGPSHQQYMTRVPWDITLRFKRLTCKQKWNLACVLCIRLSPEHQCTSRGHALTYSILNFKLISRTTTYILTLPYGRLRHIACCYICNIE